MHAQLHDGHEVHLLALTKGGATRQRHRLGLTVEEMGEVRHREMLAVERTLGLSSMTVWDYPDSGLKHLDPRILERDIGAFVDALRPDIIVTYAVHGISGFHDHLVAHAVVKRLYVERCEQSDSSLRRLALLTIPDNGEPTFSDVGIRLKHSEPGDIDCVLPLSDDDIAMMKSCLLCYETYKDTIEETGVVEKVGNALYFEFFAEQHTPPVSDITAALP